MPSKVDQALAARRRRDRASRRLDIVLTIASRLQQSMSGNQHELERAVDGMSSLELRAYYTAIEKIRP